MVTVASYSNGVIELIGLYSKANNLLLIAMYRQPDDITGGNRSTEKEFKHALCELENILSTTHRKTLRRSPRINKKRRYSDKRNF